MDWTKPFKQQDQALAQQYIQTIKYRNLVINLGNGVKTHAQLTLPTVGKSNRYDKRGVGGNLTIADRNVWGSATINDFIHDAEKALNVLIAQPEVNGTKGITIIGHSEYYNANKR